MEAKTTTPGAKIITAPLQLDLDAIAKSLAEKYRPLVNTDWEQKWTITTPTTVCDQYGFEITQTERTIRGFELTWKGTHVCMVNKITTAKLISCILMNDIVLFTPLKSN